MQSYKSVNIVNNLKVVFDSYLPFLEVVQAINIV